MSLIRSIAIGVFIGIYVAPVVLELALGLLLAVLSCDMVALVLIGLLMAYLFKPVVKFILDDYWSRRKKSDCSKCFQCEESEKSPIDSLEGHCSDDCLTTTKNHRFWISFVIVVIFLWWLILS
jgi:hypothetical protein